KRVYDAPSAEDGLRVLVDRLWPRGLSKESAAIDEWRKELAPSAELRKWFGHRPERWPQFLRRYAEELQEQKEALAELRDIARQRTVTLLYAARDAEHNNAVALRALLL